jgi:uncharacterized phosphosugar-binding protein
MAEAKDEPRLTGAHAYMDAVRELLDRIAATQGAAIDRAARAMVGCIQAGGIIYLFGTGHSHMLAEEGHFRAGGLVPVTPVLSSSLMLHESAIASGKLERMPHLAAIELERYAPTERDALVIFSNSGVNAVPVEMALAGKEHGMTVIAVVSLAYALQAPLSSVGKRLPEVADIVIDNLGLPGDAIVPIGNTGLRTGPTSTVAGAFILNSMLTEVVERLAESGAEPPVYVSSNMPGAAEHNEILLARYRHRNPHL